MQIYGALVYLPRAGALRGEFWRDKQVVIGGDVDDEMRGR